MNKIVCDLEKNIESMQKLLGSDKTVICHRFRPADKLGSVFSCCIFCIDGMVDSSVINESIVRPVVLHKLVSAVGRDKLSYLASSVIQVAESTESDDFDELVYALLYGDTILFCDGCSKALILGTKGFARRSVEEPPTDPLLKGPREGFSEVILTNISLLRRKIRDSAFKSEFFRLGSVTKTTCCVCYVKGCIREDILSELRLRLSGIDIDGVLDTNYVAELIRDQKWSFLKGTSSTERPDVAAAKLLEGRAVIFVDGSPVALTVPYVFIESFQSPEDYYVNYWFAAINRSLRILGFILSVSVVPVFVSIIMFHRELIPTQLLLSMAASRQGVPFGITIEAFMLLFTFEILREAGTRTPSNLGQTLSIVGGLVVGQAAVEARLVSPAMLIVVAFSGITGLIAPKVKAVTIWTRLCLLCLSALLGLYGFLLGFIWFILFLCSQRSFGLPALSSLPFVRLGNTEDSVLRTPFLFMKKRGRFISGD